MSSQLSLRLLLLHGQWRAVAPLFEDTLAKVAHQRVLTDNSKADARATAAAAAEAYTVMFLFSRWLCQRCYLLERQKNTFTPHCRLFSSCACVGRWVLARPIRLRRCYPTIRLADLKKSFALSELDSQAIRRKVEVRWRAKLTELFAKRNCCNAPSNVFENSQPV